MGFSRIKTDYVQELDGPMAAPERSSQEVAKSFKTAEWIHLFVMHFTFATNLKVSGINTNMSDVQQCACRWNDLWLVYTPWWGSQESEVGAQAQDEESKRPWRDGEWRPLTGELFFWVNIFVSFVFLSRTLFVIDLNVSLELNSLCQQIISALLLIQPSSQDPDISFLHVLLNRSCFVPPFQLFWL